MRILNGVVGDTCNLVVSITFDEALDTHLELAAPMLEEHGFRGTFLSNLNYQPFTERFSE